MFASVGCADTQAAAGNQEVEILAEVRRAAQLTNVNNVEALLEAFQNVAANQQKKLKAVVSKTSKTQRIERLADYIRAKQSAGEWFGKSGIADIGLSDFSWNYLLRNIALTTTKVYASDAFILEKVEINGQEYAFQGAKRMTTPAVLVLPAGKITATFSSGARDTFSWTGDSVATSTINAAYVTVSRGATLVVKSTPKNAEIVINSRQFYRNTNTTILLGAGHVHISLHVEGYKVWEAEKNLRPGGTWIINATLERGTPD